MPKKKSNNIEATGTSQIEKDLENARKLIANAKKPLFPESVRLANEMLKKTKLLPR